MIQDLSQQFLLHDKHPFFAFSAAGAALVLLGGCATTDTALREPPPMQAPRLASPFDEAEALAAVEYCVDLDAQDDAALPPHSRIIQPERHTASWDCHMTAATTSTAIGR